MSDNFRKIIAHLAAASPEELEKFLPENVHKATGPKPGDSLCLGYDRYVYIGGIGYVLEDPEGAKLFRNIEFDGMSLLKIFGISVTDTDAVCSEGELQFVGSAKRIIVQFAPHGSHKRICEIESIPNVKSDNPWLRHEIRKYDDRCYLTNLLVDDEESPYECFYTNGNCVRTVTTRGNIRKINDHVARVKTVEARLHPEVTRIDNAYYRLNIDDLEIVFKWEANGVTMNGAVIDGHLTISGERYRFAYVDMIRVYRAVGAGSDLRLERIDI